MAVGYWLDAERHLGAALDVPDHPWVGKNKATLEGALARVRTHIGTVMVNGLPRGATVTINKERAGQLPLPGPVRVVKGKAEVEVSAPGYTPVTTFVRVTGDVVDEVRVELASAAGASQPGPAAPAPSPQGPARSEAAAPPPPVSDVRATPDERTEGDRGAAGGSERGTRFGAGVVLGGVAVAALATGIVANLVREQQAKSFNSKGCGAVGNVVTGPSGCPATFANVQLSGNLAIIGYSATAVLGGLSLYLILTAHPERPSSSRAALTCAPTLGAVEGAGCVYRF
jgi:hypothetical protein